MTYIKNLNSLRNQIVHSGGYLPAPENDFLNLFILNNPKIMEKNEQIEDQVNPQENVVVQEQVKQKPEVMESQLSGKKSVKIVKAKVKASR